MKKQIPTKIVISRHRNFLKDLQEILGNHCLSKSSKPTLPCYLSYQIVIVSLLQLGWILFFGRHAPSIFLMPASIRSAMKAD